jgi:nucleotide-binding universal stress UspA family protein
MESMLVLLDRPEDIEGRLSELREIAVKHKVAKVYLARVSRTFGSRVRSIVAPHKLDMAARMSDAAASKHLSRIADALGTSGVNAEPISTGILASEIKEFIDKNNFDLIVSTEGLSRLCRRPESLTGRHVQYL